MMINQSIDNPCQGRLIAVAKPEGSIHLGELTGAVEHWVNLQSHYECIFIISDKEFLSSLEYLRIAEKRKVFEMLADWLAAGISPNYSIIALESDIPEISQFTNLIQNYLSGTEIEEWKRHPAEALEIQEFMELLLFKADTVPLAVDQRLESLEKAQQLGMSFNKKFGDVFPIIKPHYIREGQLLGVDGREMERQFKNLIFVKEFDEETEQKISEADLDSLIMYASRFDLDKNRANKVLIDFQSGQLIEQNLRKHVSDHLNSYLHSMRVKRDKWIANPDELSLILQVGARRAQAVALETIRDIKARLL